VVNAYFSVLIEYGDKYEVLDFQQLIEVQASDTELDVALRNPEYDLTKTIKKVSQQFESLEVIFSNLPGDAKMTAYITPERLPEEFGDVADVFRTVGQEMAATSRGKLVFSEVNPSDSTAEMERLFTEYGVQPLARDLFGQEVFYLHLVLELGGEVQRVFLRGDLTEADLRRAIEAAVKRATPGQMTTLGVYTEQPVALPPNPQLPPQYQPPPPQPDYRGVQQLFGEAYEVVPVGLDDGFIDQAIDVLLIGKPGELTDTQMFAVDQLLMRGGSIIALAGRNRADVGQEGLQLVPEPNQLTDLLSTYGVTVGEGLVYDSQHATFPVPRIENRGGFAMRRIELVPYALFPDIRGEGIARSHPAASGLNSLTMPWASPMILDESSDTLSIRALLRTTDGGWIGGGDELNPDFARYPDHGFPVQEPRGEQTLGAVLSGRFSSHFAQRPNPLFPANADADQGRTLKQSVADGRLAVLSSSEMASDILLQLANDPSGSGAPHRGNLLLLQNLIDWSVEDTDLLSIRGGDAFTRTLVPLPNETKGYVEILVYLMVLFPFLMVVGVPLTRARRAVPILLPKENA
jgi:ABC-2 type transport system permease protein